VVFVYRLNGFLLNLSEVLLNIPYPVFPIMKLGSHYLGDRQCQFTFWAPLINQVMLHIVAPTEQLIPLECNNGYWQGKVEVEPGSLYFYQLDGDRDCTDPASQSQPQGVHGPSAVVDQTAFSWTDEDWTGIPLAESVIYELHVGTFTPEGTFAAMIPRLSDLRELGVNTIEIMPVAQFPGERNWGYDGVYPYAVQSSYGGVDGFKQFVDACHTQGIAVILDVVYNHLGPEGNYLWGLGTYFTTGKHKTPWGSAINYDGKHSDGVRYYFVQNVLYWLEFFHVDGLRLDAIHEIHDDGEKHILREMMEATKRLSPQQRRRYLIAERCLKDHAIHPTSEGGYGLDAQWNDDFHHVLHVLLTGEQQGYYKGSKNKGYKTGSDGLEQLAKAYQENFVHTPNYAWHRQQHGDKAIDFSPSQFVVFAQNHDHVGNRMKGDRCFSHRLSFAARKLAAAATLLSPSVPLLFMGEEYGETAPFLFFVSHSDPQLVEAVRAGRKEEFAAFQEPGEPPDPQAIATFEASKLNWELRQVQSHKTLWLFYQKLLQLRAENPALHHPDRQNMEVSVLEAQVLNLRRWHQNHQVLCLLNVSSKVAKFKLTLPPGTWKKLLDSTDVAWGGDDGSHLPEVMPTERDVPQQELEMSPHGVVVYGCNT
jgi:maltooligosyltrehalose trehalohydrolase